MENYMTPDHDEGDVLTIEDGFKPVEEILSEAGIEGGGGPTNWGSSFWGRAKACPYDGACTHRDGFEPARTKPLVIGILFHIAMAVWYRSHDRGAALRVCQCILDWCRGRLADGSATWPAELWGFATAAQDLVVAYLANWATSSGRTLSLPEIEMIDPPPADVLFVEHPIYALPPSSKFPVSVRADVVFRVVDPADGQLCVVIPDHKTTRHETPEWLEAWYQDDQLCSLFYVWKTVMEPAGWPQVRAIIVNSIEKPRSRNDSPTFRRHVFPFRPDRLAVWERQMEFAWAEFEPFEKLAKEKGIDWRWIRQNWRGCFMRKYEVCPRLDHCITLRDMRVYGAVEEPQPKLVNESQTAWWQVFCEGFRMGLDEEPQRLFQKTWATLTQPEAQRCIETARLAVEKLMNAFAAGSPQIVAEPQHELEPAQDVTPCSPGVTVSAPAPSAEPVPLPVLTDTPPVEMGAAPAPSSPAPVEMITQDQLDALEKARRKQGWSVAQVNDLALEMFGNAAQGLKLTRQQAKELLLKLLAAPPGPPPPPTAAPVTDARQEDLFVADDVIELEEPGPDLNKLWHGLSRELAEKTNGATNVIVSWVAVSVEPALREYAARFSGQGDRFNLIKDVEALRVEILKVTLDDVIAQLAAGQAPAAPPDVTVDSLIAGIKACPKWKPVSFNHKRMVPVRDAVTGSWYLVRGTVAMATPERTEDGKERTFLTDTGVRLGVGLMRDAETPNTAVPTEVVKDEPGNLPTPPDAAADSSEPGLPRKVGEAAKPTGIVPVYWLGHHKRIAKADDMFQTLSKDGDAFGLALCGKLVEKEKLRAFTFVEGVSAETSAKSVGSAVWDHFGKLIAGL